MYVDIAGWHLFLRDMSAVPGLKMAAALAAQLGPAAAGAGRGGLRESDVSGVLKKIPVDVGGGRVTVGVQPALVFFCGGCRLSLVPRVVRRWARRAARPQLPPPMCVPDGWVNG